MSEIIDMNERLGSAARQVLAAESYYERRDCFVHWPLFMPSAPPSVWIFDSEPDYVYTLYTDLRFRAFEWQTNQRLLNLAARIEALENPNGALGDHR